MKKFIVFIIAVAIVAAFLPSRASAASLRGDGVVTLYRPDKNERGTFRYRDASGRYMPEVMDEIARIFRCRLTGEKHEIDPRLIEILDALQDHFGSQEVRLISTYRSPERNAMLRRHSRGVAKESLHMRGMAADIELPGVSKAAVRNFAFALHDGGVGFYRRSGFVHVDCGSLRTWGWKPRPYTRTSPAAAAK
ncbi:MAG: DUF882 domain-containing protein [bacterium]